MYHNGVRYCSARLELLYEGMGSQLSYQIAVFPLTEVIDVRRCFRIPYCLRRVKNDINYTVRPSPYMDDTRSSRDEGERV
jgi:hypothetical protein